MEPRGTNTFRLLATGEPPRSDSGCSRLDGPPPARGRSTGAPSMKAREATASTRRAVAEPERTSGEDSDADTSDRHSSVPLDGVHRTRPLRVETPSVRRRPRPAALGGAPTLPDGLRLAARLAGRSTATSSTRVSGMSRAPWGGSCAPYGVADQLDELVGGRRVGLVIGQPFVHPVDQRLADEPQAPLAAAVAPESLAGVMGQVGRHPCWAPVAG